MISDHIPRIHESQVTAYLALFEMIHALLTKDSLCQAVLGPICQGGENSWGERSNNG